MNNVTIFACSLAATTLLAVLPGGVSPARAADLTLPALPAGCQYTRQSLLPVQGTFRVEPGTPLYGVVGPQQTTFLQVSLRCDTPLSTPLTLALKGSGNLNWQCTLPAGGNGAQTLSLQVAAQVVKTGENTPVLSARALQPENGDIQLQVNGSPVPLTGTGIIAPQLATSVQCTIESGKDDTINFGAVRRNTDDNYSYKGNELAVQTQNISIRCDPQPDDASPYTVSLMFSGDISDVYKSGFASKGALKTSISDLFILPTSSQLSDDRIPINGDAVPLKLDPTTQRYNLSVDWSLMGYSPNGQAPAEYGNFFAVATYTVDVD
ncbi:hypothetical protein NUM31_004878 [Salmonella enterica]|nr:hypothetical protein [Salmonella enterica]